MSHTLEALAKPQGKSLTPSTFAPSVPVARVSDVVAPTPYTPWSARQIGELEQADDTATESQSLSSCNSDSTLADHPSQGCEPLGGKTWTETDVGSYINRSTNWPSPAESDDSLSPDSERQSSSAITLPEPFASTSDDLVVLTSTRLSAPTITRLRDMVPPAVETVLERQGTSFVAYQVALEMSEASQRVLCDMRLQRNAVFGEGNWFMQNLPSLSCEQRQAAERAMERWNDIYLAEKRGIVERILASMVPGMANL